jgi:cell division cycle 20-like protein 1, cofactor of APC complex
MNFGGGLLAAPGIG